MKRYIAFFMYLCCMSVMHAQDYTPTREVVETDSCIVVTYHFHGGIQQDDPLHEGAKFWKIPGFGLNDIAGDPAYPFRYDTFAIPEGVTPIVEVIDSAYVDTAFVMAPAYPALFEDSTYHNLQNTPDITPYAGFIPEAAIEVCGFQTFINQKLVKIQVTPLLYKMDTNTLRYYTMLKYKICYAADNNKKIIDNHAQVRNKICNLLVNNSTTNSSLFTPSSNKNQTLNPQVNNRDYLIITIPQFGDIANNFAEWKKIKGCRTHVEVQNNWTYESLWYYIHDYYQTHPLLTYVLLLGDVNDIPSFVKSNTTNHVTDLYYACMENTNPSMTSDYTPDIFIGRIPVNNCEEARVVIDKIIGYEKEPVMDPAYYNTALHCAFFQDSNRDGYADRRFAQTSEEVRSYIMSKEKNVQRVYKTSSNVTPLYWNNGAYSLGESLPDELKKPLFSWDGNNQDIINSINNGVFYVLHRDHGSVNGWGDPSFKINDIMNLNNGQALPVVFSINCQTGRFNYGTDCFAEAFLKKSNGGCVAIFAASETSRSGFNDALTEGMFDAIWPDPGLIPVFPNHSFNNINLVSEPIYELGPILCQGLLRMEETWRTNIYTREIFHLFGDPSMMIYTETPQAFTHSNIQYCEGSIKVLTNDGDAMISFYTPSTNHIDSYYGNAIEYMTDADSVIVCLDRHNAIPYVQKCYKNITIQNEHISDTRIYVGNSINVGHHVTDTKPQGDVIIQNANVILKGQRVVLDAGTKISSSTVKINFNE